MFHLLKYNIFVLTLSVVVESKIFTSITSTSFADGANPIQYNYGVAVADVDGDGKFEFIVAGYGTNKGPGAPNLVLTWNEETKKLENLAKDDPKSAFYNIRNENGKAIGVAGIQYMIIHKLII